VSSDQTRPTPFEPAHRAAGARMVSFAGFLMPIQYRGIIPEHLAVRQRVGLFDLSHMGEFRVIGSGATDYVNRMVTNDAAKLATGAICYTAMCYDHGGIVDDLLVYRIAEEEYLLVVNASNIAKDFAWMRDHLPSGVSLVDESPSTALLAVQGPLAEQALQPLTVLPLRDMPFYHFAVGSVAGFDNVLVSRTGYTGEDGFEVYIPPEAAMPVWEAAHVEVEKLGGEPVGLGARDSLRLEMKYALYGNDIDETTNPIEAGLGWVVKLDKGDFMGRGPIAKMKEDKPNRRLVAFTMDVERAIPRKGYELHGEDGSSGVVTSGTFSPSLKQGVGLGYIARSAAKAGRKLEVDIRGKRAGATIIKPPFWKKGTIKSGK
jgi:aminomethyltransferase